MRFQSEICSSHPYTTPSVSAVASASTLMASQRSLCCVNQSMPSALFGCSMSKAPQYAQDAQGAKCERHNKREIHMDKRLEQRSSKTERDDELSQGAHSGLVEFSARDRKRGKLMEKRSERKSQKRERDDNK